MNGAGPVVISEYDDFDDAIRLSFRWHDDETAIPLEDLTYEQWKAETVRITVHAGQTTAEHLAKQIADMLRPTSRGART